MHEPSADEAVTELERMLASLAPAPILLDRDHLLFRAGQESVGRWARPWQAATAFFALVAGGIAVAWSLQRPAEPIIQIVEVPAPHRDAPKAPPDAPHVAAPDPLPRAALVYFELQEDLLQHGLNALPPLPAEIGRRSSLGEL